MPIEKPLSKYRRYFSGSTIYILGTGPSNRVFPFDFLYSRHTKIIGLNQAHRFFKEIDFGITIHPHCIPLNCQYEQTIWITKKKENDPLWDAHVKLNNHKKWIYFKNSDRSADLSPDAPGSRETLYCGRGIQTAGLHLAAHLGARWAVLVGCDACSLGDDHHMTDQHTQFHGLNSKDVYNEYYYYSAFVRKELKKNYGMETLTLSPFLGQNHADEDYAYLCKENDLSPLPPPKEVEFSPRKTPLIKDYLS